MPIEPNTPNRPLPPDDQHRITDPTLRKSLDQFDRCVDRFEAANWAAEEVIDSLKVVEERMDTIVTPEGDEIVDPELAELSGIIAEIALNPVARPLRGPEAEVLCLPTVIDKITPEERFALLNTFPPSGLSLVTANKGMAEGISNGLGVSVNTKSRNAKTVLGAIDAAFAESDKEGPALTAKSGYEILEPIRLANEFVHDAKKDSNNKIDYSSPEVGTQITRFYRDFPSAATVEHLTFRAYVATIRTLRDCRERKDEKVGFFTPEARQMLKDNYGFSEENVLAHEAARIMELARHPAVPSATDDNSYGAYELPIFKIFNLTANADQLTPSAQSDILSSASWIPKEKQPAIAAQEILYELKRKVMPTEPWTNIVQTTKRLNEEGINRMMRPVIIGAAQAFTEAIEPLHQAIVDGAASPIDSDVLTQALLVEGYMIAELSEVMDRLKQSRIGEIALSSTQITLQPVIREKLERVSEAEQLEEIEALCKVTRQEIAKLDEPYTYTSKRIRSYENGPVTLSSLKQALDKHDLLADEESRRTLAMMMLQAEYAIDPVAYFDQLKETRDAIELHLGEMTYLGQNGQANVTNVLRWIDEMIDAGLENSVDHARLKRFIQDYYLGVEEDMPAVETELVVEEEPPTAPESELEPKQNSDEAISEYLNYFADVLENVDVEFSNVSFFTKTGGGAKREITEGSPRPRGERFIDIDRRRLEGLVALKADFEHAGKSARLIFTESTKNKRIPYIALYVQEQRSDSTGVCFLENVEHGTATYGLVVDGTYVRDWDELHDYSLKEWRDDWGAKPIIHPDKASSQFMKHYMFDMKHYALTKLAQVNQ